jgi:hypothetical protein
MRTGLPRRVAPCNDEGGGRQKIFFQKSEKKFGRKKTKLYIYGLFENKISGLFENNINT